MKTIAYLRVSTQDQETERQRHIITEKYNGTISEWIEIKVSSRRSLHDRRIEEIFERTTEGDTLVVSELSRLARSAKQLLTIVERLQKDGVTIVFVKDGMTITPDTNNPTTHLVMTILAATAEFERAMISQRVKDGFAAKRARGERIGRPPGPGSSTLDKHRDKIVEFIDLGVPMTKIAKRISTTRANLYRYVNLHSLRDK